MMRLGTRTVMQDFSHRWYDFRYFYCMNVARRAITLPLRKHLPSFYIAGFPV